MSVLRGLRLLVLGETWTLPLGVAGVLLLGAALRELAPAAWADLGGLVLLGGVVAVLLRAVARGAQASQAESSSSAPGST